MPLEVGDPAPDFTLKSDAGEVVTLSSFRGSTVILYFYPKDDTPGCTKQACDLRDTYGELRERGAVVLGVSPDDERSHAAFREKFDLPFPLLSDPDTVAARAYDVWRETTRGGETKMGILRSTFVVDAAGDVAHAMYGVKPDGHVEAVLEALPRLRGPS